MTNETRDMHRDPITGERGSHPIGTGVGATGGAAAGAVIGSAFGPIGSLVGGAIGAAAGGVAGHNIAENMDPTGETEYWEAVHRTRSYYNGQYEYRSDYAPAYRYGTDSRSQFADQVWDDRLEADLERGWAQAKGASKMAWQEARHAVKDAWDSTERILPGDIDRDGR